jgi:GNAT superfamily N-acetyltransferase
LKTGGVVAESTENLQPATDNFLRIRPATPSDIPDMLAFVRELAEYEREPASAVATEADLLRDGFGPTPRFHALIAEARSTGNLQPTGNFLPAGFALYFYNYSTWRGHAGIYLEDLFVRPAFRGRGVGKALLKRVAEIAVAEGCPRLEWAVLDWNTPAIDFYKSLGAEPLTEWTIMRVSGDALSQLAQSSGS